MIQVTAAILIQDGRLLLAKRAVHSKLPGAWELPGGKVETGETPEQCLAREMREEFKVEVRVGSLFATSRHEYDHGSIELLAYPATIVAGVLTPEVHEAFDWFEPDDVPGLDLAPADVPIVRKLLATQSWSGHGEA